MNTPSDYINSLVFPTLLIPRLVASDLAPLVIYNPTSYFNKMMAEEKVAKKSREKGTWYKNVCENTEL